MRRAIASIAVPVLLLSCSSSSTSTKPTSTAAPASSATVASSAASAAPTATSAAVTTPNASASASSAAAADDAPSPEPELAEWGKARFYPVGGARENGCETKMVREWIRVLCPATPDLGDPKEITIDKGRKPNEYYKGENLKSVAHIITLVQPLRRGVDFEAHFEWANATHVLDATFPADAKAPNADFDNKPPETAAGSASGSTPAEPAAQLPTVDPPIDDIAGLAPAPADADWDAAKEVVLAGSGDLGCETKVVGSWFRAKCKDPKHAVSAIEFQKGHHKTQSTSNVASGVGTVVTPYTEGTETWARFHFDDKTYMLVVRWSKGPRPTSAGSFELLK